METDGGSSAGRGDSLESRISNPAAHDAGSEPTKSADGLQSAQLDGSSEALGGSKLEEPAYDVAVKLSDMQADPNNPLYSVRSFEELGLPAPLLKGISAMNFRKPSKIQERALPLLLGNPPKNFIGQSQSGTGKTAAFTLNMLGRVDLGTRQPQALVLAPSRELARQIMGVVQTMGQFMEGLVVSAAIPDPSRRGQRLEGQVIVGTPGTVTDLARRRQLDLSRVGVIVLDEADNMLDQQGMGDQCFRVRAQLPKETQSVLFSATFPPDVLVFADKFSPQANQITLQTQELTVEGIRQLFLDCDSEAQKYEVLVKFYGLMTIASSIIFVRTRATAFEIEKRMTAEGHQVAQLSGGLEGKDRDAVIDRFRSGQAKVLIATNVLARGIDVQSVTMVINYDIPTDQYGKPDPETYLHRIGRTGRFGRTGVAISFVHNKQSWEALMQITKVWNVVPQRLDTNDWDEVEVQVKKIIKNSTATAAQLREEAAMEM
ncbi:MAG: RNA helicase required for poly(A+) mRNA export [Bathelium mastoideum]|nr:MAG: RNA helicase required for poly(A+) mRNA export [Bathelium mastoideum]KAI9694473.1 MAG: RNA helicase required for poly(A+) mRNA export [Bathelium mastoideum]